MEKELKIKCVTYGNGNAFDPDIFEPVIDSAYPRVKPQRGGLWSSPVDSKYGWRCWGEENDWGDFKTSFQFTFIGKAFVIDSVKDMDQLPWVDLDYPSSSGVLFQPLVHCGIDAVYLTKRGESATRYSSPRSLYGWDCETVFVLNKASIVAESQAEVA